MALFIADTHSLAWYFTKSRKLGRKAFQVFRNSTSGEGIVVVPTVVLAEIMDISEKKRIKVDYEEILEKIEKEVEEAVKEVLFLRIYPELVEDKVELVVREINDSLTAH